MSGWSELFERHPDKVKDRDRRGEVYGLCVHTSGAGVNKRAKEQGTHPDQVALDYYEDARYSTHYVIGLEGCWQLTDDMERVQHVGFTDPKRGLGASELRQFYLSGAWETELPPRFVERWKKQWPGYKSPSHLYPSRYPNDDFVAVECIPCDGFAEPLAPGLRFTAGQHVQVAMLAVDLAERHGWPEGWWKTPRLCTHESLGPHNRLSGSNAWDPGVLRDRPWFDWELVKAQIRLMLEFKRMVSLFTPS